MSCSVALMIAYNPANGLLEHEVGRLLPLMATFPDNNESQKSSAVNSEISVSSEEVTDPLKSETKKDVLIALIAKQYIANKNTTLNALI